MVSRNLVFLKLGGSLITDKERPYTPQRERIQALAEALARVVADMPTMCLVLGHGSGSFGHQAAQRRGTRAGLSPQVTEEERRRYWRGFAEVAYRAAELHHLVMEALYHAGLPALSFPPSALMRREADGRISCADRTLRAALHVGLVPVVYGDVVFDARQGGSILSTEEVFEVLARRLRPQRILLAGLEAGVWADFPRRTQLIPLITPQSFPQVRAALSGALSVDVTGGMASKVEWMLNLARSLPGLRIFLFSAIDPLQLEAAFREQAAGTWIRNG